MRFRNKTTEEKVDILIEDYRKTEDTLAEVQLTLKEIKQSLNGMKKFSKCAERLYSDEDGFEGDIPEMKEHLRKVNGRLDRAEDSAFINSMDVQKLKDKMPYLEEKVCDNRKYILSLRQWIIVIAVAVIGCGGGETLLDGFVKWVGW